MVNNDSMGFKIPIDKKKKNELLLEKLKFPCKIKLKKVFKQ